MPGTEACPISAQGAIPVCRLDIQGARPLESPTSARAVAAEVGRRTIASPYFNQK